LAKWQVDETILHYYRQMNLKFVKHNFQSNFSRLELQYQIS